MLRHRRSPLVALNVRNVSYNGQIAASGYTEFSFQGAGAGPTATPACGS